MVQFSLLSPVSYPTQSTHLTHLTHSTLSYPFFPIYTSIPLELSSRFAYLLAFLPSYPVSYLLPRISHSTQTTLFTLLPLFFQAPVTFTPPPLSYQQKRTGTHIKKSQTIINQTLSISWQQNIALPASTSC
jgi:hypothetical protein